ncbi:Gfo/Idh/MocA family protein [Litoreibacter janthinus]|uniref:Predicted dehydrogenase n=1 Tax=Litoreibacter janthinus TaxID=670154 RepID=A0A1I6GJZ3_9RHOB|nr:Gfo/Idh/MocA family oxidoreductase [Litoreibacter janthinus]SFR42459.1 Predicted dehydrogenase [Litoreibacter janthinus]
MRLVVAGIGLIGARHLQHALEMPQIDVVGVIDPQLTQSHVPHFSSFEAVDVEADGVVIATPSHLHADHAEAAAARGWHMLIEKPVAHSLKAADRIIAAAERAGVKTLVGHHRRHHAAVQKLKSMLDQGAIGKPVLASMIWAMKKPDLYFDVPWRAGPDGSPVMLNLVHEVDLLRFLFGEVVSVQGTGSNAIRGAARVESGAALLTFEDGVAASIGFADTSASPYGFEAGTGENPNIATTSEDYLRICGTDGAIGFPSLTVWSGAADWSEKPVRTKTERPVNVPLVAQLAHFAELCAGTTEPVVSAVEGRKTLETTLAIEVAVSPKCKG